MTHYFGFLLVRATVRLRLFFQALRKRHQNRVIAKQQKQLEKMAADWLAEVELLRESLRKYRETAANRESELTAKVEVLQLKVEMLHELTSRERERIAFETARFARGVVECQNMPGKLVT